MNVNKIIHEARGLCWHEIALVDEGDICEHCGEELEFDGYFHTNLDYTDPVHYCALMDWMKTEDRWGKFRSLYPFCIEDFLNAPRQEQVNTLAETIEDGVFE